MDKIVKTDAEWLAALSAEEYRIARDHGTERAFSHPSHNDKTPGMYLCAACGHELFASAAKYDSGTGWPSFYAPVSKEAVSEHEDNSWFSRRTEVRCARCDSHLGHVFPDGPKPTGLRYCMNGTVMKLMPDSAS